MIVTFQKYIFDGSAHHLTKIWYNTSSDNETCRLLLLPHLVAPLPESGALKVPVLPHVAAALGAHGVAAAALALRDVRRICDFLTVGEHC